MNKQSFLSDKQGFSTNKQSFSSNKKIVRHFKKVDKVLYTYCQKKQYFLIKPHKKYLESLCREIINQQLSDKVGEVIFARFKKLFSKGKVNTESILKISTQKLRGVGMSNAKVKYIKDLAFKVDKKQINFNSLKKLSDEEVISELTQVKGIGPWSAEMFLMFTLGREDIFSYGDLGLRNAIKKIYKLENPSKEEIEKIVSKWSPYKSYACRILWRSLEI
ncbi:DNA-3-methyladenine glycosylase 2 family protein [Candidatus Daviesbacteria bacterium]|nr:DNA-3-methyladenine glycosylase 2 family protein [Candidatus Daviesbacteria bacterium]